MRSYRLALHADDGFEHFVIDGDDFGVGLEAALGDDHVGELVRDVNVRHFECGRGNRCANIRRGMKLAFPELFDI